MREYDVIIAGGGAAGLMAAGVAARAGHRVLVAEKMEKPARKVRITGKGRCNLTNMRSAQDFLAKVRANATFFAPAFRAFDNHATVAFFEALGVPLEVERGERVFPRSGRAWDIADALVEWARSGGAEIACHTSVQSITARQGQIDTVTLVDHEGRSHTHTPRYVIIATGGLSYPATGSTGDGYLMAHDLGHTIEPVRPSLVPLECDAAELAPLIGLQLRNVSARLFIDGRSCAEEFGEMEFTSRGLEGAIVLRLSRKAVDGLIAGADVAIVIDLKPALTTEQVTNRLDREAAQLDRHAPLSDLLRKIMPRQLIKPLCRQLPISPKTATCNLTPRDKESLVRALKQFTLAITDYRPFEEAIVTAGGVRVGEIDPQTLQSRHVEGLYFAGEVLDLDADTGGFNLQIAFSTGHLAGHLLGRSAPK